MIKSDLNTILIGILAIGVLVHMCTWHAHGEDKTALHLAQCLMAEESGKSSEAKLAAHAWVLRKRAAQKGVSLDDMVIQYCAVFDIRAKAYYSRRARAIRASGSEPMVGRQATRMEKLLHFARRFLTGQVKDPCPAAMHFGNADDVGDKPLVEVCKWLGRKGNKLYKVKKKEE